MCQTVERVIYALSVFALLSALTGCKEEAAFNPREPARGPGGLVGLDGEVSASALSGAYDDPPAWREVAPPLEGGTPDCDGECVSYCASLSLNNPVNQGMCTSTWGVGLRTRPIERDEACRRLFIDTLGVIPSREDIASGCEGKPWGEVVAAMLRDDRFINLQRRRWADAFNYDTEVVSVERIFDMDRLVAKLYRGLVPYDQFAAVASAHPVLVRRFDTAGDRAEALFTMFMGRPPLGNERSDIGRLYALWENGYYDHPQLGMRLPDATIRYRCIREDGSPDPNSSGECTSILFGYNPLILKPDIRAEADNNGAQRMWSGLLRAEEWAQLQLPGRLLARDRVFWEKAVDDVLAQYMDYELGTLVPGVRQALVDTLIAHEGDLRVVHYAVLTSVAYLQSSRGETSWPYRWTYGPLKQVDAEVWIDAIARKTGVELGDCDHRINRPDRLLEAGTIAAWAMVEGSRWSVDREGRVEGEYRNLARSLGGCPSNDQGGRFRIVSILTTATQLNHVNRVCDPGMTGRGAPIDALLPEGIGPNRAVTPAIAEQIVTHQSALFYGRALTPAEASHAREYGEQCEREVCKAEAFARPACFALLSSAEMVFY